MDIIITKENIFSLSQSTINEDLNWSNIENQTLHYIKINNNGALLIEDHNIPNSYMIIWQTDTYEFNLMGQFSDMDEAIKIASGVLTIPQSN